MSKLRPLALFAFLLLASCAGKEAAPPPPPAAGGPLMELPVAPSPPGPSQADLEKAEALRNEGMELLYTKDPAVKDPVKAKAKFEEAAALGDPVAMDQLGGIHSAGLAQTEKSCEKAIEWFEKSSQSGYPLAINNLAYTLVSCEKRELRNAEKAEDMVRFLYQANPSMLALLDTYAAVLAEQGQFKQAAKTVEVVIDLAALIDANPQRIDEMKDTLKLYRQGKKLPAATATKTGSRSKR